MRHLAMLLSAASAFAVHGLASAQDPPQEQQPASELATPVNRILGVQVGGSLAMNYRLRWGGDAKDQDLYEYLTLDLGDVDMDPLHAQFLVRVSEDLDGDQRVSEFFPFSDITDTYRSRVNERLYYGYVDVHRFGVVDEIRIGRQFRYETPVSLYFDGATVTSVTFPGLLGASVGAYGGVPVHPFESAAGGDSLVGAWAQSSLWRGARARADFARIRDSLLFGTEADTLWAVNGWQNIGRSLQLLYRHTFLNSHNRDLLARASFVETRLAFQTQASFFYLMETQRRETTDFDLFTSAAQDYFPYWETHLLVTKGITDFLTVDAGVDVRELIDDDRESTFNHEYRRFFLAPTVADWPVAGLGFSVTGEIWDVPGGEKGDLATLGAEVRYRVFESVRIGAAATGEKKEEEEQRYRVVESLKVSAGWEYSLYKFDILLNEERERVYTYFVRVGYALTDRLRVDASFEFEDGQEDDFGKLKVGASQSF